MNDLEQMQNDLQSMQDEQTEMFKDWEDAMVACKEMIDKLAYAIKE